MDTQSYGLKPLDFNTTDADAVESYSGFNRREFIMTSLAVGFAIASKPVLAQAIVTDSKGLTAGEVSIPVVDGKIPAYRAMPASGQDFPVILVIQEIFGVHEHIKDMCRRFAKLGYLAIAPELYSRQGDVSGMKEVSEIISKVVSKVPDEQVFSDLDATLAYVKANTGANAARLGVVGFCWGGRAVWMYATHNPAVKAGVAYYGLLNGMKSPPLRENDPLDIATTMKVPVLGLYAGLDASIKADAVKEMQIGLDKSGSGSEIVVFPNVAHGFNADYRPSYDKNAAQYAWKLTQDWLKSHGV
ncbi:MAG TPA: dienelactone hydrolase family protein [Methylophilaceae bacterium]